MAKFYVGQRVRLVTTYNFHNDRGKQYTVLEVVDGNYMAPCDRDRVGGESALIIGPQDEWGWEHQFEPIVDDGHKKMEWSECIFDREGRYVGEPVHG